MPQQPMLQQIIRVQGGQNVVRIAHVQGVEAPARRAAPGGQQFIVVSQQGQPLTSQNIQRMQQSSVFPSQGGQVSGAARQAQALLPEASYTFPEGPSQAEGAPRMAQERILPFYFSNQPGTKPVYLPADSLGRPLHSAMNSLAAQYLNAPGTSQRIDPPVHQLDGAAELSGEEDDSAEPTEIVIEAKNVITKKLSKRQMRKLTEKMSHMLVAQVDGGGGGMTDSSSEDDEEEEDPLQKFVNKIDEGNGEEGEEGLREEQPLNSDDDQSDDEDLETLFDADNVVMCQFEKVHRARQKWKFHLKDGVMQIQGRDYVFSKCVGEAEW
uniref:General transcription factor IIA, 1-like n=1 Tax=Steinernema glaseri TaxID=37863 RepID=A0A1I7ZI70_9BILA